MKNRNGQNDMNGGSSGREMRNMVKKSLTVSQGLRGSRPFEEVYYFLHGEAPDFKVSRPRLCPMKIGYTEMGFKVGLRLRECRLLAPSGRAPPLSIRAEGKRKKNKVG